MKNWLKDFPLFKWPTGRNKVYLISKSVKDTTLLNSKKK